MIHISQKEHTEIYKILKFGVRVTGIQPFKYVKITSRFLVTRMSIHFFVNFDVFKMCLCSEFAFMAAV